MKYLEPGKIITLKCSILGCPRIRKYKVQKEDVNIFPEGTVVVRSKCPWHQDGDFDYESYYDKDGKGLYYESDDVAN